MATDIHGTAVIEKGAKLGEGVEVGAHAYIGSRVRLGGGCIVHHHASVEGNTVLGKENEVFPYACIGGRSQDLKQAGGNPGLVIGDSNIFRECCTVHTHKEEGKFTRLGSHNYCLAYSHIAHECEIGDHFVLGHNSTLGGHMIVGDYAATGGHVAIHPFCRLGRYSYIGGCSKVVQDVPPFMLADGSPAEVKTINKIGLDRGGFSEEEIKSMREIYKILYREGLNRSQAVQKLMNLECGESESVRAVIEFIENSERGIA